MEEHFNDRGAPPPGDPPGAFPKTRVLQGKEPPGVGQYIGMFLLMCVPFLNIIVLFVWGFGSSVNPNKKNFARAALIMAAVMVVFLPIPVLFLLDMHLPTPTHEQILQAVKASNAAETEPLDLIYEEMQIPHCYPGRAHAVLWIPDHSVQRNFTIAYDRKTKTFHVESYITPGPDGNESNQ